MNANQHTDLHPFLEIWAGWQPSDEWLALNGDLPVLRSLNKRGFVCLHTSWEGYSGSPDLEVQDDPRLHLGLVPKPFIGNPETAKIVMLMLNPGVGPHDYFAEYSQPSFRDTLFSNLRLSPSGQHTFTFLDPQFAWHGGFAYWNGKFRRLIQALATRHSINAGEARLRLSASIAGIELLPYHSERFGIPDKAMAAMQSVTLAKSYLHDVLLPRCRAGQCILLVTRKAAHWGLKEEKGVIIYGAGEARAAHLSPSSRGGKAILDLLDSGKC